MHINTSMGKDGEAPQRPKLRPAQFAKLEDLDALVGILEDVQGVVEELEARLAVHERLFQALIEDQEALGEVLSDAGLLDDDDDDSFGHPGDLAATDALEGESPEEEAARLRAEAVQAFEAGNETSQEDADLGGPDFNDTENHNA